MTKDTREIFVKMFKRYLKKRGKTQTDISRDLNVPITTVSNWYHGNRYPRPDKMQLIADYLGVSMNSLITDDEDNKFNNAEEALQYIVSQPMVAASGGYNLNEMTDEQIIDFANDLMDLLKIAAKKYK